MYAIAVKTIALTALVFTGALVVLAIAAPSSLTSKETTKCLAIYWMQYA